ncbi:hypothetical protein ACSX1A_05660 [Pontibacter sp. MBLB2868]|uniref:hypothetical protein n=1 Tax=Pontibacter sp. MBLB2868 TaxID=3451555 RepID=UPI003F7523D0
MKNQDWNAQSRQNTRMLAYWTLAWIMSMALATFGPQYIWKDNTALTLIGIVLNAVLGVGMIFANIRHMNGLDEMQRKIQLEAMGIALGVGVVGGLSYTLLDVTNVIANDAEISTLVILIALTYLGSIIIGQKRYR